MPSSDTNHKRRSIRLKDYDYSQPGGYFITICTHQRQPLFGEIVRAGLAPAQMKLNEYGEIAHAQWLQIPLRFDLVELGEFVIMPTHIHGILIIHEPVMSVGAGFTPAGMDEPGQPQTGQPQSGQPQGLPLREINDNGENQGLTRRATIGNIVGAYKSLVASECLKIYKNRNEAMGKLWHRNYYERIIRSESEQNQIAEYILSNPASWDADSENFEIQMTD